VHADGPYRLDEAAAARLLSPSLVVFRDLVAANLAAMVAVAGSAGRLRPHVKTHKMPALVRWCETLGIHRHKCATVAEAEMVARAGGTDVLIAYPLVGPNVARLARLVEAYPGTTFRATADDPDAARALGAAMAGASRPLPVLVDLDVGMGRTGIAPGPGAEALYALVDSLPDLVPDGLHAYDGHLQITDLGERRAAGEGGRRAVLELRDRLLAKGLPVPRLVLAGTPTFPVHAACAEPGVELSPGTGTLYDANYRAKFPDLPFVPAAALLTRVVSRPRAGRVCLDLGHKAVAADPPAGARLTLLGVPDAQFLTHSEEHLVVETALADSLPVGTPLLALPAHVCPTSALHQRATVVDGNGAVVDEWVVESRDRVIGV
jgi:D-serine deaminase-like pyridoxal phosphate-dependent protein